MNENTPFRYQRSSRSLGNMEVAKTMIDGLIPTGGIGAVGSNYLGSEWLTWLFGAGVVVLGVVRLGLAAVIVRSKPLDPIT